MRKNKIILFFVLVYILGLNYVFCQNNSNIVNWGTEQKILNRIIPPKFPKREFNILKFGAVGDGKTDCTNAINNAIKACSESGGGKVIIPEGVFFTGAIYLKSNVNLYISKGATLKFSTDPEKYLPVVFTRWEGVECYNYSSLIYAYNETNIAITGEGLLDGCSSYENWWAWKGTKDNKDTLKPNQKKDRDLLFKMGEDNVPVENRVFGLGHYLRPNFIQFYKCKNVLISGIKIINSPMWVIHPVLSQNISIIRIHVEGFGPNTDGCDPESCKDVLIKDCCFNNGDDCIAIKSGRNNDGRRVGIPSENIVIKNCTMIEGHGGVVMGSEISGGVRNVFVQNCWMNSPNLDRALRFKTNSLRGGLIENIFMKNVKIGQVGGEILRIDYYYEEGDAGTFTPIIRNVNMDNIICNEGKYAIWIKAYDRSPVENITISNSIFKNIKEENIIENVKSLNLKNVKINNKLYNIKNFSN
jgi:polygalacturonase